MTFFAYTQCFDNHACLVWYHVVPWLTQERAGDMFFVRLDLFHALNRLSRTARKTHGAFRPFMARLRDACFLVNRDDVLQASCW